MIPNVFQSFMFNSSISLFRVPMLTVQDLEALHTSASEEIFITQQQLAAHKRLNATTHKAATYKRPSLGSNATHPYLFKRPASLSLLTAPGGAP